MSFNVTQSFMYETDKLQFRGLYRSDTDGPYVDWMSNAKTARRISQAGFPDTSDSLRAYIEQLQTSEQHLVWVIIDRKRNSHIGIIALQNINRVRLSAGFAVILGDETCWRQGHGEAACRLIFRHGFQRLGLQKIYGETSDDNAAMIGLATKLGMQREGLRREALYENGRFLDQIEFGILKQEFVFDVS